MDRFSGAILNYHERGNDVNYSGKFWILVCDSEPHNTALVPQLLTLQDGIGQ